jgi:hypothetical protein
MSAGKRPDYRLSVKHKMTGHMHEIGAGWLSHDGSINITLQPCTVLDWRDEVVIKLFPPKNVSLDGYPRSDGS